MPYLVSSNKCNINSSGLEQLKNHCCKHSSEIEFAGELNYINFYLIKCYIDRKGKKYWLFALLIGSLICCVMEVYRRLISPYEDKKITENGDVEVL